MLGSALKHFTDITIFSINIFIMSHNFFKISFYFQLKEGKLDFFIQNYIYSKF